LQKDYDVKLSTLELSLSRARSQKSKDKLEADKIKLNSLFQNSMKQIDDDFERIQFDMEASEQQFNILLTESKEYLRIVLENNDKMRQHKVINSTKLKNYANSLALINRNLGNVQQGPNESEEEFKARLLLLTAPLNDDEAFEAMARLNFVQAKRNFKEFFTDGAKVETIIKKIDDPEFLHQFNKVFLKIKPLFLAKYGVDNKKLEDVEVIEYIQEVMSQPNFITPAAPTIRYLEPKPPSSSSSSSSESASSSASFESASSAASSSSEPVEQPPQTPAEDDVSIMTANTSPSKNTPKERLFNYAMQSIADKSKFPLNPTIKQLMNLVHNEGVEIPINIPLSPTDRLERIRLNSQLSKASQTQGQPKGKPMQSLVEAMTGQPAAAAEEQNPPPPDPEEGSYKGYLIRFANYHGIEASWDDPQDTIMKKIDDKGLVVPKTKTMSDMERWLYDEFMKAKSSKPKTGVGIKNYSKMMKFGKVAISPDDLYYKNILKIRLHNKRSILGIPDIRVSDSLAAVLMKIVDGEHVTRSDLSILSKKDKMIYDKLMVISGLHKTIDNSFDDTAQEMKQRMRLIEGELGAGNNNPMLLKESHQLLNSMHACGMISARQANKHYKDIKTYF
jgi:hypothetical protein